MKVILDWLKRPKATWLAGEPIFKLLGKRRNSSKVIDISKINRILILRLDNIGDVVMMTPFFRELRGLFPHAHITLLVRPVAYNLVELCPYVDKVLAFDHKKGRRIFALKFAIKYLFKRSFDMVINPRWDVDYYYTGFLGYFSGAPLRVGYSENVNNHKKRFSRGSDILLTHVLENTEIKHEVERSLDLIRFLGGAIKNNRLELWLGEEDEAFASNVLNEHGVRSGELIVGLGPSGGNSPLKQWPIDNFIKLGQFLRDTFKCRFVVFGAPGETELGEQIKREIGLSAIDMVGKTTLRQAAALMKKCCLYIGNDAGPMHMAAAMDIPLIALFSSSCRHRFSPWGEKANVLSAEISCNPCMQFDHPNRCNRCSFEKPSCVLKITVEQVKEAVKETASFKGWPVIHE